MANLRQPHIFIRHCKTRRILFGSKTYPRQTRALFGFLEDGIPYLMDIGSYIAIFPTPDDPETVDMPAIEFAARINKILDESYGEALDLPNLNG